MVSLGFEGGVAAKAKMAAIAIKAMHRRSQTASPNQDIQPTS